MMRRRTFVAGMSALATGVVLAQPRPEAARIVRVGILRPTAPATTDFPHTISSALREFGYIEGRNASFELAYAGGNVDRLPALARDLVHKRMDVIVTIGSGATLAVKEASATVPIVMFGNFDPLAMGIVASLSRPGGNVTGVLIAADGTLAGKKLELIREAVPRAARIALLVPDDPNVRHQVKEVEEAAARLGIALPVAVVRGGDYEAAFRAIAGERVQALFVGATTFFVRDRAKVIALATRYRLPAIYEWPEQVEDGGLMAYGASLKALYRRVAFYVDRIIKGTPPGDLPVEQPTTYELAVNLRSARAIGLVLPQALLLRADRVIE
ncbi:MAG: ABC transporter substrate-binding protein [Burkholderiales bacterium]